MTLPSSGDISMSEIYDETTGLGPSGEISLNDASVRSLFEIPSDDISMSDGYGLTQWFYSSSPAWYWKLINHRQDLSLYWNASLIYSGTVPVVDYIDYDGYRYHKGAEYSSDVYYVGRSPL